MPSSAREVAEDVSAFSSFQGSRAFLEHLGKMPKATTVATSLHSMVIENSLDDRFVYNAQSTCSEFR